MSFNAKSLSKSAQSVQEVLRQKNLPLEVVELSASTRTAQDAAQAIGCTVAQIIKSLIFCTKEDKCPILVLVSGTNRADEKLVAQQIGAKIGKADADFVRSVTGFAIGGIPPVGHTQPIKTYIDKDLLQHKMLWAAAGTPHAVFSIPSNQLVNITGGRVITVCI